MKKKTVMLLICAILIGMCGCKAEKLEKYQSVVISTANDGTGISVDRNYWDGVFVKKDSLQGVSRTIQCNNNQYSGTYMWSITDKLESYVTDIYVTEDRVRFGLHERTGEVVLINLMTKDFFDTEPYLDDVKNPEENALEYAKTIAKTYVTSIDEYEILVDEPSVYYKERDGQTYKISYHMITFAKKIGGFFTSDYISVKISSKGNLASISMGDIGAFDKFNIEIDEDLLQTSVLTKVSDACKKAKYDAMDPEVNDQKLAVTPDGQVCVYSEASVTISVTEEKEVVTGLSILTVIED